MLNNKGFSLIELLVVVAIIGLLAGGGTLAYTTYLDGVKVDRVGQQLSELGKAIDTQMVSASVGSRAGAFSISDPSQATCTSWVDSIVEDMNETGQNVFDSSVALAVNGHDLVGASDTPLVKAGQISLHCASPSSSVGSDSFAIYQCSCTQPGGCSFDSGDDGACPLPASVN